MDRSVKLLLTLLVLLGGLSVTPAQARACLCDMAVVEQVASEHSGVSAIAVARARFDGRAHALALVRDHGGDAHAAWTAVLIPTIRYGDQARE